MKHALAVVLLIVLGSCKDDSVKPLPGMWKAEMLVQDDQLLPFIFEFRQDNTLVVFNADERVEVNNIEFNGDSITLNHPVFEGTFKGVYTAKSISGDFVKPDLGYVVPFTMTYGEQQRFAVLDSAAIDIAGVWEMEFSPQSEEDRYIAKGNFESDGNKATGTIRTTTGDYRYLEGVVDGNTLKLSTFDGAHVFLFVATVSDTLIDGIFYSGNHWREPFTGKRNPNYELPDANSLTFLKDGYNAFDFAFPMQNGDTLSLSDPIFKDKVAVIQIMGTWCPNCLDESKFFVEYLANNPAPNVQFAALAFEYSTTQERAYQGINRLKERLNIPYPIALAQVGSKDKGIANEKLPMLNHILSFPTTIVVDKQGKVRNIHTGFNGPATGDPYLAFKAEFTALLDSLSAE